MEGEIGSIVKPNKLIGFRHVQMLMLFLGLALAYAMRATMSIAIVAMTDVDGSTQTDRPHLPWDILAQASVLSAFMTGYVVSQVPGRRLAARVGGKVLVVLGVAGSAAVAPFIALGANDGSWQLTAACRFVQGVAQGPMVPGIMNLIHKWVPLQERRLTEVIVICGAILGVFTEFLISGFIIKAWGWPMVFYTNTIAGGIWSIAFIIIGSKSAETSRFISEEEKVYIRNCLKQENDPTEQKTPWFALWTSVPFLSVVVAHCGQNWGLWSLVTLLPLYFHQTQELDIEKNGFFSSVPFLAMFIMILPLRFSSNWITKKNYVSVTTARKTFSGIGFFGPAIALLALVFFKFSTLITTVILTLALALNAAQLSGFMLASEDMAPNFCNRMGRITNGIADLVSVFAPLTAGVMLNDNVWPAEQNWGTVLILSAAMYVACGLFYIICGTSEKQIWNEPNVNIFNIENVKASSSTT